MTDPMELVERLEKITAKPAGPGGIIRAKKRDLIEAAACIRELVEWRPIETAPKDGKRFESQDRGNYGHRVFTDTYWYVHPSVQAWVTAEIDCCDYEFEPSHWRPSPPADRGGV